MLGKIKYIDRDKGYGYIEPEEKSAKDVAFYPKSWKELDVGMTVTFALKNSKRGNPYAVNVASAIRVISDFMRKETGEFIADLERKTGSAAGGEKVAWENSLCVEMKKVLADSRIKDNIGFAAEYQIPRLSERIDMVLTGKGDEGRRVVLIVELKQWSRERIAFRKEEDSFVISGRDGTYMQAHPSEQMRKYKRLIELGTPEQRRRDLEIHCIGYLHNYQPAAENDPIKNGGIDDTELFFSGEREALIQRIAELLPNGDDGEGIAYINKYCTGYSHALNELLKDGLNKIEEIMTVDQINIYEEIKKNLREAIAENKKRILTVKGGPGTGKSLIAMYAAAKLYPEYEDRSIYFLSKNSVPRDVFANEFAAAHAEKFLCKDSDGFIQEGKERNSVLLSLIDESHRLTPETLKKDHRRKRGADRVFSGDNQIIDIIEASLLSVFFIDEKQIISLNDGGTIDTIKRYCTEKKYLYIDTGELTFQHRCGGSDTYIKWVDSLLGLETGDLHGKLNYDVKVMDSFDAFYEEMQWLEREMRKDGGVHRARIAAGKCWEWKSLKEWSEPDFPANMRLLQWNKPTYRDKASREKRVWATSDESFGEIGCIHTCQGVEFDYIGVIIGPDLLCENGRLQTNYDARPGDDNTLNSKKLDTYKSNLRKVQGRTWEQAKQEAEALADSIIRNTYRVLLTRGLKGCRIYCANQDGSLNQALSDHIKKQLANCDRW